MFSSVSRQVTLCQVTCSALGSPVKSCRLFNIDKTCVYSLNIHRDVCVYRQVFQLCGDVEGLIAMETLQMEVEVENQILQHLTTLVEVDVPSIQKLRKQLTSRTLDMDSARARYCY